MKHSPPIIVRLTAVLYILYGMEAAAGMVASACRGDFFSNLDFGVLAIPIGCGLLVGKPSSRFWVMLFASLGLLVMAWLVASGIYPGQVSSWGRGNRMFSVIDLGIAGIMCVVSFIAFRSASVRAWFNADPAERQTDAAWIKPLLIVSAIIAGQTELREFSHRRSMEQMFAVQTHFEFHDASTGKPIKTIAVSKDETPRWRRGKFPPDTNLRIGNVGGFDGTSIDVRGVSTRPVEMKFSSEGYQLITYTLDSTTPAEVRLELQPEK